MVHMVTREGDGDMLPRSANEVCPCCRRRDQAVTEWFIWSRAKVTDILPLSGNEVCSPVSADVIKVSRCGYRLGANLKCSHGE